MKQYNLKPKEVKYSWGTMNILKIGDNTFSNLTNVLQIPCFFSDNDYVKIRKKADTLVIEKDNSKNCQENWLVKIDTFDKKIGCKGLYIGKITYTEPTTEVILKVPCYEDIVEESLGWYEYLLIVQDGSFLQYRVSHSKQEKLYWIYFDKDKAYKFPHNELNAFCEGFNLKPPIKTFNKINKTKSKKIRKKEKKEGSK